VGGGERKKAREEKKAGPSAMIRILRSPELRPAGIQASPTVPGSLRMPPGQPAACRTTSFLAAGLERKAQIAAHSARAKSNIREEYGLGRGATFRFLPRRQCQPSTLDARPHAIACCRRQLAPPESKLAKAWLKSAEPQPRCFPDARYVPKCDKKETPAPPGQLPSAYKQQPCPRWAQKKSPKNSIAVAQSTVQS